MKPIAAAIAGVALGAAAMWMAPRSIDAPLGVHAFLLPPENNYLTGGLALSPDARTLAFVASDANGERQIWIRPLDSERAQSDRRHQRRQRSVLVAVRFGAGVLRQQSVEAHRDRRRTGDGRSAMLAQAPAARGVPPARSSFSRISRAR